MPKRMRSSRGTWAINAFGEGMASSVGHDGSRCGNVVPMAASSIPGVVPGWRGSRRTTRRRRLWRTRDLRSTRYSGQTDRSIPAANHIQTSSPLLYAPFATFTFTEAFRQSVTRQTKSPLPPPHGACMLASIDLNFRSVTRPCQRPYSALALLHLVLIAPSVIEPSPHFQPGYAEASLSVISLWRPGRAFCACGSSTPIRDVRAMHGSLWGGWCSIRRCDGFYWCLQQKKENTGISKVMRHFPFVRRQRCYIDYHPCQSDSSALEGMRSWAHRIPIQRLSPANLLKSSPPLPSIGTMHTGRSKV